LPSLADVQSAFGHAVLAGDFAALAPFVCEDGISAAGRIGVYRNNVTTSLTALLAERFAVVARLVGDSYFRFAAESFIRSAPPGQACLDSYGAAFPDFLAEFPSCAGLPYLPDVARLEWKLAVIARAGAAQPIAIEALAATNPALAMNLRLCCDPAIDYLASEWPVRQIWQAHQSDEVFANLDAGGCRVELRRRSGQLIIRPLTPAEFAFRVTLAGGASLAEAVTAALDQPGEFDFSRALVELFVEQWAIGWIN